MKVTVVVRGEGQVYGDAYGGDGGDSGKEGQLSDHSDVGNSEDRLAE